MKRHARTSGGLSLIELLVVVAIIAILASMLMPVVGQLRRAALTVNCANNQRQLAMGFMAYAQDQRELPSCYHRSWTHAWNWGDESAGFLDSPRGPGGGTYGVNDAYGNPVPNDTVNTPFSLAWDGDYVVTAIKGCGRKTLPPFGRSWFPWYAGNNYMYNGPGAMAANIGNNSNVSGLYTLGGYRFGGAVHGWSLRQGNAGGAAQTALFSCPGVSPVAFGTWPITDGRLGEPHGGERWTPIASQFDWPVVGYDSAPYNRNVTFADGHVAHLTGSRGKLKDQ